MTHPWDAIITEYDLPEFDAFAALSIVSQSQPDIPFIVISNAVGERLAVEMLKAGAHDYLMQDDLTLLPDILQTEVNAANVRLNNRQDISTLRETEEKYRALYDNAIEGIYQSTPAGHYLMANMALARMYGYASPEAMISSLNDIQHQLYVDPQRRETFEQTIAQQGYVVGFESEVYCQDGTILWISENGWVVCDDQGRPGYYQGFVTDISDRKRIEAIHQLGETRATTAFEQAAVGFSECNVKTGQLTLVNPYFCKMMGYTQTELLEMTINDITHPDDAAESIQKLHQLSLGQTKSFKLEKRYCRKDGTIFWAEITIGLVRSQTD
ncbi:MAG: PAS domain S-box protein, partial [Cyanobacteria bacterium J06656_5]